MDNYGMSIKMDECFAGEIESHTREYCRAQRISSLAGEFLGAVSLSNDLHLLQNVQFY